jgi:hypothetical protein
VRLVCLVWVVCLLGAPAVLGVLRLPGVLGVLGVPWSVGPCGVPGVLGAPDVLAWCACLVCLVCLVRLICLVWEFPSYVVWVAVPTVTCEDILSHLLWDFLEELPWACHGEHPEATLVAILVGVYIRTPLRLAIVNCLGIFPRNVHGNCHVK